MWPKPVPSSGPGGAATPCSNHGTCKGAGDRKGKGKCKCETGYIGKRCAKCGPLYYKEPVTVEGEVANGSLAYVTSWLSFHHFCCSWSCLRPCMSTVDGWSALSSPEHACH